MITYFVVLICNYAVITSNFVVNICKYITLVHAYELFKKVSWGAKSMCAKGRCNIAVKNHFFAHVCPLPPSLANNSLLSRTILIRFDKVSRQKSTANNFTLTFTSTKNGARNWEIHGIV